MRTLLVVVCVACDAGAPNLPSPQAPVADPHAAQDLANGFDSAVLGVLTPRPVEAGRYGMAIDVSFNAGEVRSALHGWMTLELAPDGTAYSCIAAETADERGVSRATAALAGAWKLVDGVAQIAFHGIAPRAFSCHPEKDADKDAANKAANKAARELDFETTSIATTMSWHRDRGNREAASRRDRVHRDRSRAIACQHPEPSGPGTRAVAQRDSCRGGTGQRAKADDLVRADDRGDRAGVFIDLGTARCRSSV